MQIVLFNHKAAVKSDKLVKTDFERSHSKPTVKLTDTVGSDIISHRSLDCNNAASALSKHLHLASADLN